MKPFAASKPACRHCRYYTPEGRRGGQCQQLNVAVQGGWEACSLAIPVFTPAWENLEEIMRWQHQQQTLANQEEEIATPTHPEESTPVPAPVPVRVQTTIGIRALWM